ncbi:MAG: TlyA family RNA methyltransferase [Halanaerobiales bacterium]|nr:TlyA family RNA methyltransferase [Halanaerobiales bacterium]
MATKERIDIILTKKGFYNSRNKAKRAIMAGEVYVNDQIIDKPGTKVKINSNIEIKANSLPYVSRGGLKLAKAIEVFKIDPKGKEVFDIGASTGGFTDCLLQNGAKKVYAIDVGYGQLAWKLRQDDRVEVIERTNFRHLEFEDLPILVPLIVTDVSFISLRLIVPKTLKFLTDDGQIVALIKPQFEAGRDRVGKKGIINNKDVHLEVITKLSQFFDQLNLRLKGLDYSPIKGATSKNIEFLIYMQKDNNFNNDLFKWGKLIKEVVNKAHQDL